jgi:hypothetical protein
MWTNKKLSRHYRPLILTADGTVDPSAAPR